MDSPVFYLHDAEVECTEIDWADVNATLFASVYVKSENGCPDVDVVELVITREAGEELSTDRVRLDFERSADLFARIRTTIWSATAIRKGEDACAPLGEHYVILATDIHGTEVRVDVPPIRVEL